MKRFSALALILTTLATIAVMWSRAKWATTVPEVLMCAIGLVWSVQLAAGRKARAAWVLIPLTGVVLLAAIQLFLGITVYNWPTRLLAMYWAANLATLFVGLQIFIDRDTTVRYRKVLVWFGGVVCLFATIHAMTSPSLLFWSVLQPDVDKTFAPFLYVNQYAAFVELLLPVAIFEALTATKGRVWYTLLAALLLGSVLYSGSRGGAALTVIEMLVVPLLVARRYHVSGRQLLSAGGVLLVALLWVAAAAGPDNLVQKMSQEELFGGRADFNRGSLAMFRERPLLGFGLGNWPTAYPGYANTDDGKFANQAHNDWAQWAVEGGLPMLAMMLLVAVWAVPRALRSCWGFGVAVILIHCLWDYPIQRPGVAIVFFTMLAALAPYGQRVPDRRQSEPADELDAPAAG